MDEDLDEDDVSEDDGELLGFLVEDYQIVGSLVGAVRSLLERPDLPPRTISRIGVFLFALGRLPFSTPGVNMSLSLEFELNDERDWRGIRLENDRFALESGFSVYDPKVGGDHQTEVVLEVGSGYRNGNTFEAYEFADHFVSIAEDACRSVVIEDYADDPFEGWELGCHPGAWGGLPSDYC